MDKVVFVDFGTTFNKCTVYIDGDYRPTEVIPNRIFEITKEQAEAQKRKMEESELPVGIFTERDIVDAGLTGHAKDVPVQTGAVIFDQDRLKTAYRNTFEVLETHYGIGVLNNVSEWHVMSAVALPETEEIQKKLAAVHQKVLLDMGFAGCFIRNQIYFAIVGNADKLSNSMTSPFTVHVVDIGGGDMKTVSVSREPMLSTIRRESLGGVDVLEYCRKIMEEQLSVTVMSTTEIQDWLIQFGDCDGNAPHHEVHWKGHKLDIQDILNAPRMLFEPKMFQINKRSLTDIVAESLQAAREKGKDVLMPHLTGCMLLTGGGSLWGGIIDRLVRELEDRFPEFKGKFRVIPAGDKNNPKNAVEATLNGMTTVFTTGLKKSKPLSWAT